MPRNLASIKKITKIEPIKGKDRIVLATVDGWSVIIQKKEFNTGDLCVYCEIDSVLPAKPEYAMLEKTNYRVKTMKMAGVISQGICFPLEVLPKGNYKEGQDVTEIMGITKYEPYIQTVPGGVEKKKSLLERIFHIKRKNKQLGAFPKFINKTDEVRIQNIPGILKEKEPYVATEKVDGQSGTFVLKKEKVKIGFFKKTDYDYMICSRNYRLDGKRLGNDMKSYFEVSAKYNIKKVLENLIGNNEWVAIQAECVGPGVNGNKYKLEDFDAYVFNLIYPSGRMGSLSAKKLIEKQGMKFVPIVNESVILPDTVDEVLKYAHAKSMVNPDIFREGIVFRTPDGVKSFKAVDPLYLLKYDE